MKTLFKSRRSLAFYLMAIPAVMLFFCFHTIPVIQGVIYSFTNYKGFGIYHFVGFQNYIDLFSDDQIINSYVFTFKFAIVTTILVNILSLVLAVGLNSRIKFKNTLRSVYFMPNILSTLIVGYIFNYAFAELVPVLAQKLHMNSLAVNLLGTNYAWVGIVIMAVWQATAFQTILYISGLQTISDDVYEASAIDGANAWTNFWKITFPLIAPFFTINMVLAMKNFLMIFDQIVSLTGGGPGESTESISYVIYNNGFNGSEFAYQSANAVVYLIVIIIVSVLQIRFLQKREVQM